MQKTEEFISGGPALFPKKHQSHRRQNGSSNDHQKDQDEREGTTFTDLVITADCRGLDNAGKTTILRKFNNEDTSQISPTLGFNIKTLNFEGYQLNLWDIGGQATLRPYWRNYFEETDGLVWVVDACDVSRLGDTRRELHALLQEERLMGAPLLVFVNKQDLAGALGPEQVAEALGLAALAHRAARVQACSAVSGAGLVDGLAWLQHQVVQSLRF